MARNIGELQDAETNGNYEPQAVLRSTITVWGDVIPTQTRSARATETVNFLEARSLLSKELFAKGGRWLRTSVAIAKEVLLLIETFNEFYIDYEPTPAGSDSSGAVYGIPFGDWADVETRCDTATLATIAAVSLPSAR